MTASGSMINVYQPSVGAEELAAVAEVFESNWLGRGPRTAAFESAFADHLGVERNQVTSVNSCTEALFLSMQLAGVGRGDDVVLPTISFVGAGNAVGAQHARPVFCDVDERTLNPTVDDVAAALTPNTRAVLLLHYGGYPGDVTEIAALCRERGILLIEDAACAIASRVDSQACGTIGDIGTWSFDPGKIVVTGDGGMLHARDPELIARAAKLAHLGMEQVSGFSEAKQASARWWEFDVSSFSRRSIMNDVQSSIGLVQLSRLKGFLARRREVAARYDAALGTQPGIVVPPPLPAGQETSHYFYWVQLDEDIRDSVARDLYDHGIYTTFRYAPLHLIRAYGARVRLPGAERAAARTLCLPIHQSLTDDDVDSTIAALVESVTHRRPLRPAARASGSRQPYLREVSEVYDAFYQGRGKDFAAEADAVTETVRAHLPGAQSLLDVACGTGEHLRRFTDHFGDVTGLELSRAMCEVARNKLPQALVHQQDMRGFDLGRTYSAVCCLSSTLAYMTSTDELATAVAAMARHLSPGGVLVIDPWYTPEQFRDGYVAQDTVRSGGSTIVRLSHSSRSGTGPVKNEAHYLVADAYGVRHFTHVQSLTLFRREEYLGALRQAGLTAEHVEAAAFPDRGLFVGIRPQ